MGWEPARVTERDFDSAGRCIREVTVSEPEWSPLDLALVADAHRAAREPRGPHGIPIDEAIDPANHPLSLEATGRFVASPYIDFAQYAIDQAEKARRETVAAEDDWPLLWSVRRESTTSPEAGQTPPT